MRVALLAAAASSDAPVSTPDGLAAFMKQDFALRAKLIKDQGVKLESPTRWGLSKNRDIPRGKQPAKITIEGH